jgi:hypothetical protein
MIPRAEDASTAVPGQSVPCKEAKAKPKGSRLLDHRHPTRSTTSIPQTPSEPHQSCSVYPKQQRILPDPSTSRVRIPCQYPQSNMLGSATNLIHGQKARAKGKKTCSTQHRITATSKFSTAGQHSHTVYAASTEYCASKAGISVGAAGSKCMRLGERLIGRSTTAQGSRRRLSPKVALGLLLRAPSSVGTQNLLHSGVRFVGLKRDLCKAEKIPAIN